MRKKVLSLKKLAPFSLKESETNKVRRAFVVPGNKDWMALFTTNKGSVGDVVVGEFKGKGAILNTITALIKTLIASIIPTDLVTADENEILELYGCTVMSPALKGRICIVKRALVPPFECIVRIRLRGSLLKAYVANHRRAGYYLGHWLPAGMTAGQRLPIPIFTPSTKAPAGQHDENIDFDKMVCGLHNWMRENNIVGWDAKGLAQAIRSSSLAVAMAVSAMAEKQGLIYEDTKFEFGLIPVWKNGKIIGYTLVLVDEVMTPDSSRIVYKRKNVCKQYLRNVVEQLKKDGKKIVFTQEVKDTFIDNYYIVKVRIGKIFLSF